MTTIAAAPPLARAIPKLSDEMFRQFREFIYKQTGIYFQDNKKYLLEGRLGKRLQILNIDSFEKYNNILISGPNREDELKYFYTAITINETFFFRNEPQFEAFEKTLVPEIINLKKTNGRTKLRVWSAASSSGEEAYTLAMIYLEKLRARIPGLEIEIIGTDINHSVLETAKKGVYRDYAIRNIPREYLDKYFIIEDGKYTVKDEVKKLVHFDYLNLYDEKRIKLMLNFDIIFCTNVLIYFDTASKIQVVARLFDSLNRGGFLFVGYAESLHGISKAFKLINFPKTVAYMKE